MKQRELRLGNYIEYAGVICEVEEIHKKTITANGVNAPISSFLSIPLTEEWLLKLGFEKKSHIHNGEIWVHRLVKITWYPNGMIELRGSVGWSKIIYVHQLQNLYFALTGEELTLNNK